MRFTILLFALALHFSTSAQNLSRDEVLRDLDYLYKAAVLCRHPCNHSWGRGSGELILRFAGTSLGPRKPLLDIGGLPDSLTPIQTRLAIGALLQTIGDGHAVVLENPLARADSFYFPLPVALVENKLILLRQCPEYPADLVGRTVERINGVPTADILSNLSRYAAADGGGTHFAKGLLRINLVPFLTAFFGGSRHYSVDIEGHAANPLRVDAIRTVRAGVPRFPMLGLISQASLRRGNNALHLRASDSTAVLSVTTFSKKDKAFFRNAFSRMSEAGTSRLVLDLRGNTGGARDAAVALTKHLVQHRFGYSLLRPHGQHVTPHLNRKGRMFYALGRLKYAVAAPFRPARMPIGRGVRYRFNPASNPFSGRLAVITDGLTFSSSSMVTSWIRQHGKAVFVGSQAGGGYNGNWGGSFPRLRLPQSGMVIQLPAYRLVLDESSDKQDGIVPDVPVSYTVEDVLHHNDPVLDAALDAVSAAPWKSSGIQLHQ